MAGGTDPWASAMAEVEDAQQRDAGLWARSFAEADGDESRAKAAYIKARVDQLSPKPATGYCPNCNCELPLTADACANCKAIFDRASSWAPTEKPQGSVQPRKGTANPSESGSDVPIEAKPASAGFKWWLWVPIGLVVGFFVFSYIGSSPAQRAAISARADCERVFPMERGGKCNYVYDEVLRRHSNK